MHSHKRAGFAFDSTAAGRTNAYTYRGPLSGLPACLHPGKGTLTLCVNETGRTALMVTKSQEKPKQGTCGPPALKPAPLL